MFYIFSCYKTLKHPLTTRIHPLLSRPASSICPDMAIASFYPLQQAFRFIAFRFRQQFSIRLREQQTLCSRTHAPPGIAAACPARRYAQVFPEIKTGFSCFSVPRPGLDKMAGTSFHPPSGIVHTVSLQRQRSTVSRPLRRVKSPFRHPRNSFVFHDPAYGPPLQSSFMVFPDLPAETTSSMASFFRQQVFRTYIVPALWKDNVRPPLSRHTGLRKIPVCRGYRTRSFRSIPVPPCRCPH